MKTAIVVHPAFDMVWPFSADHFRELLEAVTDVSLVRLQQGRDQALRDVVEEPGEVERLISLGMRLEAADLAALPALQEAFAVAWGVQSDEEIADLLAVHGVRQLRHRAEGYWGQSVAEYALGLTLGALRGIPQVHHRMVTSPDAWQWPYQQFCDDPRFANGTIEGKRVRVLGMGNIGSRYASFAGMLGADVAGWSRSSADSVYHRTGARRALSIDHLVHDAEIFAPMLPDTPSTEGVVTADHIRALPRGCLVILVTRATVVDMGELRRRVLADELSLAADVFDLEPLPQNDPLVGRHNVVHTPHNGGRTRDANLRYAEEIVEQLPEFVWRTSR
jgi:phosphoglycerate dehydrogenase-like enzyme